MNRTSLLGALAGLAVTGISSVAAAQLVCTPGQGCKVVVAPPPLTYQPPPVQWQPPPATWQAPPVTIDPSIQAQAKWQAEIDRRARWDAYFSWRAQVWASAQASGNMQAYIEPLKYQARMTPDNLAYSGASYGLPSNSYVSFPRIEIGFLAVCFGIYSGSGAPTYIGYCPALRLRVSSRWAVALDPAYVSARHDDRGFGMFGLRPGVEFTFAQGRRDTTASRGYAVAGFDLWLPTTSATLTPTAFLGGHLGLGAMLSGNHWGIGFETRALVRGGVGAEHSIAQAMSSVRLGFELRAPVVSVGF